ncbi:unnamed protein product, partial [Prorocentrum cordatum]
PFGFELSGQRRVSPPALGAPCATAWQAVLSARSPRTPGRRHVLPRARRPGGRARPHPRQPGGVVPRRGRAGPRWRHPGASFHAGDTRGLTRGSLALALNTGGGVERAGVELQEVRLDAVAEAPSSPSSAGPRHDARGLARAHPREDKPQVRKVFWLFMCIQIMVNYDGGAIPAILGTLREEFQVSEFELGVINSVPYLGILISSTYSGLILQKCSQKTILSGMLIVNAMFCALLAVAPHWGFFMLARIFLGLTQGPFIIYVAVWVEEFAPVENKTSWVGIVQVGVPLGVTLGYLVAGFLVIKGIPWRYALGIQCITITLLSLILVTRKCPHVDNPWTSPRMKEWREAWEPQQLYGNDAPRQSDGSAEQTGEENAQMSDGSVELERQSKMTMMEQLKLLANQYRSLLRVADRRCTSSCRASRCGFPTIPDLKQNFVLMGQTQEEFDSLVMGVFSLVALTGPATGVIAGGIVVDMHGGYSGLRARITTLKLMLGAATVATISAISLGFIKGGNGMSEFWYFVVLMWLVLCAGGAIVPPGTGIMLTVVRAEMRAFASSVGQGFYNIFGFGMGSLLPGVAISLMPFENPRLRRQYGMMTLFGSSFFAWLSLAYMVAKEEGLKRSRSRETLEKLQAALDELADEDELPLDELQRRDNGMSQALRMVAWSGLDPQNALVREAQRRQEALLATIGRRAARGGGDDGAALSGTATSVAKGGADGAG